MRTPFVFCNSSMLRRQCSFVRRERRNQTHGWAWAHNNAHSNWLMYWRAWMSHNDRVFATFTGL